MSSALTASERLEGILVEAAKSYVVDGEYIVLLLSLTALAVAMRAKTLRLLGASIPMGLAPWALGVLLLGLSLRMTFCAAEITDAYRELVATRGEGAEGATLGFHLPAAPLNPFRARGSPGEAQYGLHANVLLGTWWATFVGVQYLVYFRRDVPRRWTQTRVVCHIVSALALCALLMASGLALFETTERAANLLRPDALRGRDLVATAGAVACTLLSLLAALRWVREVRRRPSRGSLLRRFDPRALRTPA